MDVSCKCKKPKRQRLCNFTDDASFDFNQFISNSSYYRSCDCALYTNCSEVPIVPPVVPPIVPPTPPSGGPCVFTCEDIQYLQVLANNLTLVIKYQQDQIDLLIDSVQNHTSKLAILHEQVKN